MAALYAKPRGRRVVISGPRVPEYLEKAGEKLRELSVHLEKAMGNRPPGSGGAGKK